jgi:hypothetical protein
METNLPENYFNDRDFSEIVEAGTLTLPREKIGGAFLYEGTTTYLFSRTNYGKSLLVFQFAYAAATGTSIGPGAALENKCDPMKVVVVDLELEEYDLAKRHMISLCYMDPEHVPNLRYLHVRKDKQMMLGPALLEQITNYIYRHRPKLVIIDNISSLLPDTLKAEPVMVVITFLNQIKKLTGASIMVIGHTTKGNPKIAIQPTDYFGSSMVQNFFSEVSFLDRTNDGKYFLCHAKTKREECYTDTVPVFTRGAHPVLGVGFTFETLRSLTDVQLPYTLEPKNANQRPRNLTVYRDCIDALVASGKSLRRIAEFAGVSHPTIAHLLNQEK